MEDVFEKPNSMILFRQLSKDSGPVITVLDSSDSPKNQSPKIVDMKMKNIFDEEKSSKNMMNQTSNKSDLSPQVSKIEKSLFIADLQKKLSAKPIPPRKPNQVDSRSSYVEMTDPRRNQKTEFGQDFDRNDIRNCNQEIPLYVEMRPSITTNNYEKINLKESLIYDQSTRNGKLNVDLEVNRKYVRDDINNKTELKNENLAHIYEDVELRSEKNYTSVALIKGESHNLLCVQSE